MFPNSKWISAGWLWLPASVRIPAGELFAAISRIGLWPAFFCLLFLFFCQNTGRHLPSRSCPSGHTGMQSAQVFRFTTTGEGISDPSYGRVKPDAAGDHTTGRASCRSMINLIRSSFLFDADNSSHLVFRWGIGEIYQDKGHRIHSCTRLGVNHLPHALQ